MSNAAWRFVSYRRMNRTTVVRRSARCVWVAPDIADTWAKADPQWQD